MIEFAIPRIECMVCRVIRQVKVAFADFRRTYTRAFDRYVLELSKHMTISDVAHHFGVGGDMIKDIQKRYLKKRFSRPKLNKLKQIAIDEIAIGKGHRHLTVVLELATGAVDCAQQMGCSQFPECLDTQSQGIQYRVS